MNFNELLEAAKNTEKDGNITEAVLMYEKCIVIDPNHKEAILSLSRLYLMSGKPIRSIELLMKRNVDNDKDFLVQLSNTFMTLNQFDEAEHVLKKALSIKPESAILNNLGVVAIRRNKGVEAIDFFTESLRLDENNVNTWFNLATYYESQGDPKKAKDVIEQALKKIDQVSLKEKYIQLLNLLGDSTASLVLLEKELEKDPNNLMFQVAKMRTLVLAKQFDECLEWILILQDRVDLPPNLKLEILDIKEKCYFFKQEIDTSLEIIDQLLLLSNGNPAHEFRKAYLLAVKRNFKDSLALLKQIMGKRNIPLQIQQESISLMKSIEIENWKTLITYLMEESESREMLVQNFSYLLETRNIFLPEEGIRFLKNLVQHYQNKNKGFDGQSDFLN